jgi:hypothetical protein
LVEIWIDRSHELGAEQSKSSFDLAIPAFGYKSHVPINRGFAPIRP